jgi:hypothetical protein
MALFVVYFRMFSVSRLLSAGWLMNNNGKDLESSGDGIPEFVWRD